ncbi:hypothetical protein F4804DRAFT_333718 [Jackrogersella minutella]|nr:hypothetical protein F4804DRAFT_333718 [Jackrogersella minutella]
MPRQDVPSVLSYFGPHRPTRRPPLMINDEWREFLWGADRPNILIFDPDIWAPGDPDNFFPPGLTNGVLRIRIHGQHTALRPERGQLVRPSVFPWWYKIFTAELFRIMFPEPEPISPVEPWFGNVDDDDGDQVQEDFPEEDPANYPPTREWAYPRHGSDPWWPLSRG